MLEQINGRFILNAFLQIPRTLHSPPEAPTSWVWRYDWNKKDQNGAHSPENTIVSLHPFPSRSEKC